MKADQQTLNGHKSCVLWFTGLSGSGKSTLATVIEEILHKNRIRAFVLDGDHLRIGLNKDLGFSREDRDKNILRSGEVAKLFIEAGMIILAAFISPYQSTRDEVRKMFEKGEFIEIYLECSLEECESRDPKGLYQKARKGMIQNFTGVSDVYEPPVKPELIIETSKYSVPECASKIIEYLEMHCYIQITRSERDEL